MKKETIIRFSTQVDGYLRPFVQKALLEKLYELGFRWYDGTTKIPNHGVIDTGPYDLALEWLPSGNRFRICYDSNGLSVVSAKDVLSGKFDILKWVAQNTQHRILRIDLSWLRGEAREVVSKAIQERAFSKGYTWGGRETTPQYTTKPYLYIWEEDKTICYGSNPPSRPSSSFTEIEISVNKALKGEY